MNLGRYRKLGITILGLGLVIAETIPPDSPGWRWAQVVTALAAAVGVRQVRNDPYPDLSRMEKVVPPPPPTTYQRPERRGPYDQNLPNE